MSPNQASSTYSPSKDAKPSGSKPRSPGKTSLTNQHGHAVARTAHLSDNHWLYITDTSTIHETTTTSCTQSPTDSPHSWCFSSAHSQWRTGFNGSLVSEAATGANGNACCNSPPLHRGQVTQTVHIKLTVCSADLLPSTRNSKNLGKHHHCAHLRSLVLVGLGWAGNPCQSRSVAGPCKS
eukprot:6459308-Amphidinium_carterae.1